jgi:peptidoglycan/xylan/chitin deacetylase (PgdA/CDA1 family)
MPHLIDDHGTVPALTEFNWTSFLGRVLITALSPGGEHSRLSILIYHRVLRQQDPLFPEEIDAWAFDHQMRMLKAGFNIIPLGDAVRAMRNGRMPPRAACITFDDGYADNEEVALPILKKHGIPATFFIATGFLDGGRMWNDTVIETVRQAHGATLDLSTIGLDAFDIGSIEQRRQTISTLLRKLKYLPLDERQGQIDQICRLVPVELPANLMMKSGQVANLHNAGMEIGGHTVNHPILARLDSREVRNEIATGKETLENIIHAPVRLFAYPNGKPVQDYLPEHVEIVKSLGFEAAVSTAGGAARRCDDLYQLPRFTPWDKAQLRFTLRLAKNMLRKTRML